MSKLSSEPDDTSRVVVVSSAFFTAQREAIRLPGPFYQTLNEEVDRVLTFLVRPSEAFAPFRALQKRPSADLSGVFRYKGLVNEFEFGLRIFYIGCPTAKRVVILEYGERNPGKPGDAYALFGKRLQDGYYDAYFRVLGLKHAYWQVPDPPKPLHSTKR